MKAIGPTFMDELNGYQAARDVPIIGAHFTWQPDGTIEFFDDTPEDVVAAVNAVYEAHDPTKALPEQV